MGVSFHKTMLGKGLTVSFLDNEKIRKTEIVQVEPHVWSKSLPLTSEYLNRPYSFYNRDIIGDDGYGMTEYWNMTYFTDLPKYSMNYDFWITARGADSEHKPFQIEFLVDGKKITQANLEEMAEKYPD